MSLPGRRTGRRTVVSLLAVLAVLVGIHMAFRNPTTTLPSIGLPALHITLRGQVAAIGANGLMVNLEDPHGALTGILRRVTLTADTRVVWTGVPSPGTGRAALSLIKPGYRVAVRGQAGADNTVVADVMVVGLPPLTGTVASLTNGQLAVEVPGQKTLVLVQVTSRTAFFVPGGQWQRLAPGAPVRVLLHFGPNSTLVATAVMVGAPTGGS
jgi:hypothetical protein